MRRRPQGCCAACAFKSFYPLLFACLLCCRGRILSLHFSVFVLRGYSRVFPKQLGYVPGTTAASTVQSPSIRLFLGCVNSTPRREAGSLNLGKAFLRFSAGSLFNRLFLHNHRAARLKYQPTLSPLTAECNLNLICCGRELICFANPGAETGSHLMSFRSVDGKASFVHIVRRASVPSFLPSFLREVLD